MFTLRQKVVMWALYSRIIVICLQVSTHHILLRLQKKNQRKYAALLSLSRKNSLYFSFLSKLLWYKQVETSLKKMMRIDLWTKPNFNGYVWTPSRTHPNIFIIPTTKISLPMISFSCSLEDSFPKMNWKSSIICILQITDILMKTTCSIFHFIHWWSRAWQKVVIGLPKTFSIWNHCHWLLIRLWFHWDLSYSTFYFSLWLLIDCTFYQGRF